jgi:MFS family permease
VNAKDAARNVRLYRLYVTFREPLLWGSVLISFIMHVGHMSLAQIYFMESVVLLGTIFLQVPTGALADLIGRKKTVIFGSIVYSISIIWFTFGKSPFDMWGADILCMFGISFCDGADSAFLYDSLKAAGRESEYKKIDGESAGNRLLLTAVCNIFAGYLAEVSFRLPLFLSIPGVLLSLGATLFLKEPPRSKKFTRREQWGMMKSGILFTANHKSVRWIIGFTTLIGVTSKIWFFTYNPYFELVKLDLKYYGIVFFTLNLIAWFFSKYAHEISHRFSEKTISILMVFLIGLPILFMGSIVAIVSVCMVFPQNIVRGFMRPFFGEYLNRHLNSENRATVISVQQSIGGFAQFVCLGIFGFLTKSWGLPFCLQILSITVLGLGSWYILRYKKIFG